jgi:septal ring factor EnvC (AmiA/AmiB activator)
MKREDAKALLIKAGIEEPTKEQISLLLDAVGGEIAELKENHKTEIEKLEAEKKTIIAERDELKTKQVDEALVEQLKKENETYKQKEKENQYLEKLDTLNVDKKYRKFVLSEVEKGETIEEFEANAKKYVEANPHFTTGTKVIDTNPQYKQEKVVDGAVDLTAAVREHYAKK